MHGLVGSALQALHVVGAAEHTVACHVPVTLETCDFEIEQCCCTWPYNLVPGIALARGISVQLLNEGVSQGTMSRVGPCCLLDQRAVLGLSMSGGQKQKGW
jgi:hypothetical protein